MYVHFGFIESIFTTLSLKANHEVLMLSGIVVVSVVIFCIFISINHFRSKKRNKINNKLLAAIMDQRGAGQSADPVSEPNDPDDHSGSLSPAFVKELIANAQSKAVTLAALQTILGTLLDAGVPDAEIPNRLLAATDQLEALRSSLVNWPGQGQWHEQIRSEILAFVDRGDFDSACAALRHGREAGWTSPMSTDLEEAEFYAREAMIDHLQLRYCAAARTYAAAAALIMDGSGKDVWRFLIAQAHELCDDAREFGTRENLLGAIEIYHRALGLAGREQSPHNWAATKHHLGNALLLLGERDKDPGMLQESVEAYLAALEEWTRERAPREWAKAQNNLGHALQLLGEQQDDKERLRQAAEAYRAALAAGSRDAAPFDWGRAYNRLGDTLAVLGVDEDDSERLKEAIEAYREALNGVDRELAPLDWARTQNNLGKALEALGESEPGTGLLRQAVAAYREALEERCRVLAPSNWATTNTNLGNALVAIAERENSNLKLEEAASAYRAAIEARPAESAPLDTAKTHINLAYTLGALWNRTQNRKMLDEALSAIEAALGLIREIGVQEQLSAAELARETILTAMGRI